MKKYLYSTALLVMLAPSSATPIRVFDDVAEHNLDGCIISSSTLYPEQNDAITQVLRQDFFKQCLKRQVM